jgi:hypothetical protein
VSMLYPEPAFASSTGSVSGSIRRSDGALFQGAYVIARKVGDPRLTAVGVASGARYTSGSSNAALRGLYEIPGLPPGDYTIEIEEIHSAFTGGSSVGPVDPPADLPGPAEFWNGADENGTNADEPAQASTVAVGLASSIGNLDVTINGTMPVATATPASTASRTPTPIATPAAGLVCAAAPEAGCRNPLAPLKATLLVKDRAPDTRDQLAWKWTRGADTAKADFGDPLTATRYALCVYDDTANGTVLVLAASVPAGGLCADRPCWQETTRGFRYKNRDGGSDGVSSLTLKEGAGGAAQIALKATGSALAMPAMPFAQSPRVTVQLKNDRGFCRESRFTAPATRTSDVEFRDKSD